MYTPELPYGDSRVSTRWREQRRRRRLLEGDWHGDLVQRANELVGNLRRSAWGFLDQSANPLRQLCDQFATIYDHEPVVKGSSASDLDVVILEGAAADSGYWALMQRVQRDTVGVRDFFVRLDIDDEAQLVYERIWPDIVYDVEYDDGGQRVMQFAYLRIRKDPKTGAKAWYWDVLEVDGGVGRYAVVADAGGAPLGEDYSAEFLTDVNGQPAPPGGLTGDRYPYQGVAGPYVPVVRYRAQLLGRQQWDYRTWIEVVEGSLNVAVYWSFWAHALRNASWPQRYAAGVHARAQMISGDSLAPRREVTTDPAVLLEFELDEGYTGQPVIGQFQPGADIATLSSAVSTYESRIAAGVGISPSDLTRTSGDPRSGYALAVSNEALRKAQRRFEPAFRQGDMVALSIMAALLNRALALSMPESGWRVEYVALPLSVEERRELRSETFDLLDRGFIDQVEAMRRLNGSTMTREQARIELERVRAPDRPDDVKKTPLSGAQVSALQQIIASAAAGAIPIRAAKPTIMAAFPGMPEAFVDAMIAALSGFRPTSEEIA